jgi:ribosomal protein L37AE/L43A
VLTSPVLSFFICLQILKSYSKLTIQFSHWYLQHQRLGVEGQPGITYNCIWRNMNSGSAAKIRFVRCPKCRQVLVEPQDIPVYKCGGCGTHLQGTTLLICMCGLDNICWIFFIKLLNKIRDGNIVFFLDWSSWYRNSITIFNLVKFWL